MRLGGAAHIEHDGRERSGSGEVVQALGRGASEADCRRAGRVILRVHGPS